MMTSSTLDQHDMEREPWRGGYRSGYRRRFPFFPFWLIFPLMFLAFRGSFTPGIFAVIPLVVMGIIVLQLVVPLVDGVGRSVARRSRAGAERGVMADASAVERLELDLIEARREIRALEQEVAWQKKLLETAPGPGRTTA
jgi:hypothetical protein